MTKYLVVLSLFFNTLNVFGECDFSIGITKNDNSTFIYSKECHIAVGEMKRDLLISQEQIKKLGQAIDLKDQALSKADQRANLWMETSFKLENRLNAIDKFRKDNELIYFGLGMLTMFAAAYVTSKTISH